MSNWQYKFQKGLSEKVKFQLAEPIYLTFPHKTPHSAATHITLIVLLINTCYCNLLDLGQQIISQLWEQESHLATRKPCLQGLLRQSSLDMPSSNLQNQEICQELHLIIYDSQGKKNVNQLSRSCSRNYILFMMVLNDSCKNNNKNKNMNNSTSCKINQWPKRKIKCSRT